MKTLKKIAVRLGYTALGLCALFAAGWFVPFPIEGNWLSSELGCMCDSHNFMRFEDGKILHMSEHHPPCGWLGSYQRKGWGQYEIEWLVAFNEPNFPLSAYSTFFRVSWLYPTVSTNPPLRNLMRDPFVPTCRKVVNAPENDWVRGWHGIDLRVTGTADERVFVFGERNKTKTLQELQIRLEGEMHPKPMQIYTASNEAPSCVIETLTQNGFDYHVHSNQQWIVTEWVGDDKSLPSWKRNRPLDTEDANPIWTNKTRLIFRPPPEKDNMEDPEIWFLRKGEMRRFSDFKKSVERHRSIIEDIRTNLYFYAEGGVLPEDVRQMLAPLGLDYHVLDEKILYRGKASVTASRR